MLVHEVSRLVEVQLGDRGVERPTATHQYVIDLRGQAGEERLDAGDVAQIHRGRGLRADLPGGVVEPFAIAPGDDEPGAGRSGLPGGLQSDPRTSAEHDDDLPG